MDEALNFKSTSGQFGRVRVLPTMTIHQHENGTFFVTDDWNGDRLLSSGIASVERAIKLHQYIADRRTLPV